MINNTAQMEHTVFQGHVAGDVTWRPGPSSRCVLRGGAAALTVNAPADAGADGSTCPILDVPKNAHVDRLTVMGGLGLGAPEANPQRATGHPLVRRLTLCEGAHLHTPDAPIDLGHIAAMGDARLSQAKGSLIVRLLKTAGNQTLTFASPGSIQFREPEMAWNESTGEKSTGASLPLVRLVSGLAQITASLEMVVVDGSGSAHAAAELYLEPGGQITALAGNFRLRALRGARIVGAQLTSPGQEPPALVEVTAAPRDQHMPNVDYPELTGGEMVGVDVTHLPFSDIQALSRLHVFEPDDKSLMRHAKKGLSPARRQDRSQRLKMLADVVADKALSGAIRSAVWWSSARAHHSAVHRRHIWEQVARWAHRAVGYGYRPGPALLTYVLWVLSVAAVLWQFDSRPACAMRDLAADGAVRGRSFVEGPYTYWQQVLRVLFLPAGLLRLEVGGAATYAPIGCSAAWHLPTFAITGLILVYVAVALRNYLRTPKDS